MILVKKSRANKDDGNIHRHGNAVAASGPGVGVGEEAQGEAGGRGDMGIGEGEHGGGVAGVDVGIVGVPLYAGGVGEAGRRATRQA